MSRKEIKYEGIPYYLWDDDDVTDMNDHVVGTWNSEYKQIKWRAPRHAERHKDKKRDLQKARQALKPQPKKQPTKVVVPPTTIEENIKKLGAIILESRPALKPITIKQYESQLTRIPKIFNTENIEILYDPDVVIKKLKELENDPEVKHHFTSSRNLYNAIIVLLQALKADNEIIKKYINMRDELNDRYKKEQESGVISAKQKPNFATKQEVESMIEKLKDKITEIKKKKTP